MTPPLFGVLALDGAIRRAQGERPPREWDVWDLAGGPPNAEGGINDLIGQIEEACPIARGRLDAGDSGTLRLRRWGPVARSDQMEGEIEAWLAAERARRTARAPAGG